MQCSLILLRLLLLETEAAVDLLGAHCAQLIALLGNEFAPLAAAQVSIAQFLPLFGLQVAKLLTVLQSGLRVILQLPGLLSCLLRIAADIALIALFGDQITDLLALLGNELAPLGRLEIFGA